MSYHIYSCIIQPITEDANICMQLDSLVPRSEEEKGPGFSHPCMCCITTDICTCSSTLVPRLLFTEQENSMVNCRFQYFERLHTTLHTNNLLAKWMLFGQLQLLHIDQGFLSFKRGLPDHCLALLPDNQESSTVRKNSLSGNCIVFYIACYVPSRHLQWINKPLIIVGCHGIQPPPERRGSGDIRPIHWALLKLVDFC